MNPLDRLEPLVEPQSPSWWPPAPGWWLLGGLLAAFIIGLGYWLLGKRKRQRPATPGKDPRRLNQAALRELAELAAPPSTQAGAWLGQLNALLKRLCQALYPDEHPQGLSGAQWLAFLDRHCAQAHLSRWPELADGAYRSDCQLDTDSGRQLRQAVETWIRRHA